MTSDINETKEFDLEALRGHTPGPYLVDGECVYALNLEGSNRFFACVSEGWGTAGVRRTSREEKQATARLFAAAPELLAECKRLREELAARRAREEAVEAIAAADNTLHSAMDHWQERAIRAEAALRARDAELEALRNVRRRISAVVQGTDDLRSEALVEVRELLSWGHAIDAALRPFHPSGSEGESK